ncbi:hypothetical protein MicloDRAFT_00019810 [Microvirga lotononidis]|uniref:Uncharacterized protein n=1 Tax=Microvirga lotononidis TaxID=864069 RepID=I4YZW0_9HYPH|nr:hypothetical protein MicloDRAFT_00019810 [Microvirga lotononidis]
MNRSVAGDLLETQVPQRHIVSCVGAVRSSFEGEPGVPDAAHNKSLSIPVIRLASSSSEGIVGRSQKDTVP